MFLGAFGGGDRLRLQRQQLVVAASAHFLKRNHVVIFGVISNQYIKDLNHLGANCQAISWKWNTKRLHASFWIGGSNSQTRNGEHPDAADDTVSPILIATDDKCCS